MKVICDWNNCKETGTYKAPVEKDNSKKYRLLCLEHIKIFNKNWNYFENMNNEEIEYFIKSDLTWHKSTKNFFFVVTKTNFGGGVVFFGFGSSILLVLVKWFWFWSILFWFWLHVNALFSWLCFLVEGWPICLLFPSKTNLVWVVFYLFWLVLDEKKESVLVDFFGFSQRGITP